MTLRSLSGFDLSDELWFISLTNTRDFYAKFASHPKNPKENFSPKNRFPALILALVPSFS